MATRFDIEEELLLRRFPAYSKAVREIVQQKNLDEETIRAIWEGHRPALRYLKSFSTELAIDGPWAEAYQKGQFNELVIRLLTQYLEAASVYSDFLSVASDEDILNIQRHDFAKQRAQAEEQARTRDAFAWFSHPDCDLDLPYWQGINNISADEAAAIALSKDPRRVKAQKLRPYLKVSRSLFCEKYGRLFRSAGSFIGNSAKGDSLSWNELLYWMNQEGLSLGKDQVLHNDGVNDLETRKSHTYQKILFSLLRSQFGLERNLAPAKQVKSWCAGVSELLIASNFSISDRTIKTCLTEVLDYYRSVELQPNALSVPKGEDKQ